MVGMFKGESTNIAYVLFPMCGPLGWGWGGGGVLRRGGRPSPSGLPTGGAVTQGAGTDGRTDGSCHIVCLTSPIKQSAPKILRKANTKMSTKNSLNNSKSFTTDVLHVAQALALFPHFLFYFLM